MDLKTAYNQLKIMINEGSLLKEHMKEVDTGICEKIADKLEIFDKQGKANPKKVKSGLVKKAIDLKLKQENKLEVDLDLMEKYFLLMKNGDVKDGDIKRYSAAEEELKEHGKAFNLKKKEIQQGMEPLDFQALMVVIKDEMSGKSQDRDFFDKIEEIKEKLQE